LAFIRNNSNPSGQRLGDCVIRAVAKATNKSWEDTYIHLAIEGFLHYDLPNSNEVWGDYLESNGFTKYYLSSNCPDCYSVKEFCNDHKDGIYVLGTGTHAITVVNGNWYDVWDSGDEIILFYFKKEEN
jgi:hypothetical protein